MKQGGLQKVKSAEKLLDDVLSWHSLDEQRSTLVVTVLEARGMQPRKGTFLLGKERGQTVHYHACLQHRRSISNLVHTC